MTVVNVISNDVSDIMPLIKIFDDLCDSDPDAIITQWTILKLTATKIEKRRGYIRILGRGC